MVINLHHYALPTLLRPLWDSSKFSLAVTSVINTYLAAFNTLTCIYLKLAIGHLMQALVRFVLQCFSLKPG